MSHKPHGHGLTVLQTPVSVPPDAVFIIIIFIGGIPFFAQQKNNRNAPEGGGMRVWPDARTAAPFSHRGLWLDFLLPHPDKLTAYTVVLFS